MLFSVYQLKLVENKHYFGTTPKWRKPQRLSEHRDGGGAKWTQRFPPVEVDPVVRTWEFHNKKEAYAFEDRMCCEFLNRFGIDSTRGGLQNYGDVGQYSWWCRPHLRHLVPNAYDWNS